jgi:hypothetical protein
MLDGLIAEGKGDHYYGIKDADKELVPVVRIWCWKGTLLLGMYDGPRPSPPSA